MLPVTLFLEAAAQYPYSLALRTLGSNGYSFTYAQLLDRVKRVSHALRSEIAEKGERVALVAENSPYWGAAYLSIIAAGATVVPFDMNLPLTEIDFILRDSGASVIVASETAFAKMSALLTESSIKRIPIAGDFPAPETWEVGGFAENAALVYTSGTTGVAKGVMLSGEAITSNITGARDRFQVANEERFFSILPLYHTYECTCGLLLPLSLGASVSYARSLKPNELLEDARTVRPTLMLAVPLILEKIRNGIFRKARETTPIRHWMFHTLLRLGYLTAKHPGGGLGVGLFRSVRKQMGLDQIKLLVSGGAALPHSIERDFMALGFPILQGYGLSECAPLVAVNSPWQHRFGSVGKPLGYAETRIESPDSEGVGMLYVRGPMVMNGYWNNPEKTTEVIDKDGWFKTGDLGKIDNDGMLYIVGRRKDVIVTAAGKNIYPETLEQALLEDERILETVVIGRPRKQGQGEEIGVIIVFNPDWIATESESHRTYTDEQLQRLAVDIVAKVNEGQPDYRRITRIEVSKEELEKTNTRKIRRYKYK